MRAQICGTSASVHSNQTDQQQTLSSKLFLYAMNYPVNFLLLSADGLVEGGTSTSGGMLAFDRAVYNVPCTMLSEIYTL